MLPPRLTMTDVERMYDEGYVIVQGVLVVRVRTTRCDLQDSSVILGN